MTKIEIDLFMLYHVWLPLFGFAISGAMAIGFIIGISRELCRHRSMSFMERSTRWCSWWPEEGGVEFIRPAHILNPEVLALACSNAEDEYFAMLANKEAREHARDVLPLATATRLYVTGTYDYWIRLLKLRLDKRAHPEMRRVMNMLCKLPDFPDEILGMVAYDLA